MFRAKLYKWEDKVKTKWGMQSQAQQSGQYWPQINHTKRMRTSNIWMKTPGYWQTQYQSKSKYHLWESPDTENLWGRRTSLKNWSIIIGEILLCTPLCRRTAATSMSWNMISSAANLSILLGVFGVPGVQVTRIECVPAQAVCLSVCPPVCLSVCLSVCPSVCPSLYFAMSYKNDCGVYYGVYHCVKSGGRTGNFSIPFLNLSCSLTELISVDYHGEVYSHQVNIQPGNVTLSCLGYFLEKCERFRVNIIPIQRPGVSIKTRLLKPIDHHTVYLHLEKSFKKQIYLYIFIFWWNKKFFSICVSGGDYRNVHRIM